MSVEGSLDLFRLPEILQVISQQGKTGILTVQGQQDIVAISFLNGRIVAADALNQTLEEGLAQVLVGGGWVSPRDFADAAAEHQNAGGRLVDLLVDRGYMERPQLLQALRVQTNRLLTQVLSWDQGDFKFYGGDEVSYEEGFTPILVEDLLLQTLSAEAARPSRNPAPPAPTPAAPAPPAARLPRPTAAAPVPPDVHELPQIPDLPEFPEMTRGGALIPPPPAAAAPGPRPVPAAVPSPIPSPRPSPAERRPQAPGTGAGVPRPLPPPVPFPVPTAPQVATAVEPPLPAQFRKMKIERTEDLVPGALRRGARWLAFLLVALLVAVLLYAPQAWVLPFPWQSGERLALAQDQRTALYLKIDRGAKTFYLLEARFPDHLPALVRPGLLSPGDLADDQGRPLSYAAKEDSYTLAPLDHGKPVVGAEATEAITGNFFLDPSMYVSAQSVAAPIVLLD